MSRVHKYLLMLCSWSLAGVLAYYGTWVELRGGTVMLPEAFKAAFPWFVFVAFILWVSGKLWLDYMMWWYIDDGYARMSPGKALGFQFIPLFNFYWVFQVYAGFAEDYNAYVVRHNRGVNRLPVVLFGAFPSLLMIGLVGSWFSERAWGASMVLALVVYSAIVWRTYNAIVALARRPKEDAIQD